MRASSHPRGRGARIAEPVEDSDSRLSVGDLRGFPLLSRSAGLVALGCGGAYVFAVVSSLAAQLGALFFVALAVYAGSVMLFHPRWQLDADAT